jgi:hypothetical protein
MSGSIRNKYNTLTTNTTFKNTFKFDKEKLKVFLSENKKNKLILKKIVSNPIIPKKSYPLNQEKVKEYLENTDISIRPIIKKLFDNTKHISYKSFKIVLYQNFRELINFCKINKIDTIILFLADIGDYGDSKITRKSNFWVAQHFYQYLIAKKVNINLEIITNPDKLYDTDPNHLILILDDCSYTGSQLHDLIEDSFPIRNELFNLYIIIAYVTEPALNKIMTSKKIASNVNIILSRFNNIINSFYEYLSSSQIKKAETIHELNENKYPIYFDHKLADNISTYTSIYLGKVINDSKDIIIPVMTNCEHIKEVSGDDLWYPPCPITPYKLSSSDYNKNRENVKIKSSSISSTFSTLKTVKSLDYDKKKKTLRNKTRKSL